jgi:hypothetical protein
MPTISPAPYSGEQCIGTINYDLRSSTPLNQTEYNVSQIIAYQSPLWIEIQCKDKIREYSCNFLYQPYGVWFNEITGLREQRVYCPQLCEEVMIACEQFFDLAETIGLHYQSDWYGDDLIESTINPRKFVKDHCNAGTTGGTVGAVCYMPEMVQYVETSITCPDPTVIPDETSLAHSSEVYIPRFTGSECAISCPNIWYRRGTYYLNSFVLYILATLSCLLGFLTLCQHTYVVYEANRLIRSEQVTANLYSGLRKQSYLSEQVAMLCGGVTVSNAMSVLFMFINNVSFTQDATHPLQCQGNAGFLLSNGMCFVQGALIMFTICWQQAWTGKICSHMFSLVRPYHWLTRQFQGNLWQLIQVYFPSLSFVSDLFCPSLCLSLSLSLCLSLSPASSLPLSLLPSLSTISATSTPWCAPSSFSVSVTSATIGNLSMSSVVQVSANLNSETVCSSS